MIVSLPNDVELLITAASVVDFSPTCEPAVVLLETFGLRVSFAARDVVVFSFSTTNVVVVVGVIVVVVEVVAAKAVQLNTVGRLKND